jgi:glycosyltransferase involved in cell wall biosynthesis
VTALRVAYVLGTTAGGTGRHVAMLAHGCLRAGMTVSVFGPEQAKGLFRPGTGAGFDVVQIAERPRPVRDVVAVTRLSRLLARARPDVVHAHGLRAGALAALALALRPPGRRGRALVVTVHNGPPEGTAARLVYGVLERVVARRSDTVACVSADLVDRMRRRGARHAVLAVVPAPPAMTPAPEAVAQARCDLRAEGRPVVLAVGRLTGQKGFDILLSAATRWQDRSPRPLLAIAGQGPLAAGLAGSAKKSGLSVRFLGQRADVRELLAVADVLAAPSRWDGQPLLLQEALQAGTPIVASRVGGVPDVTGDDAALLVPPGDPAQLAAAVLRVLDHPDLAERLRSAAVTRAASLPSEASAVAAAIALYHRRVVHSGTSAEKS